MLSGHQTLTERSCRFEDVFTSVNLTLKYNTWRKWRNFNFSFIEVSRQSKNVNFQHSLFASFSIKIEQIFHNYTFLSWCRSSKASAPGTSFASSSDEIRAFMSPHQDTRSLHDKQMKSLWLKQSEKGNGHGYGRMTSLNATGTWGCCLVDMPQFKGKGGNSHLPWAIIKIN